MAESSWSALYDEAKSGVVAGIPEGTYTVEVTDARTLATSRLLFIDLKVLEGPQAGKTAQVNLYLPEAGNRGAGFHFRNKILGFGDLSAAFQQMDHAADIAGALSILADALIGRRVYAEIELRNDGDYAGTNQLAKTKPVDDAAIATVTPIAPQAAAAPAMAAPQVAAPQEAAPAAAPQPQAAVAEVPF